MLPFLLIQTRPDTEVAEDELRTTTDLGEFAPGQLRSLRLDQVLSGQSVDTGPLEDSPLADQHAPDSTLAAPTFDWDTILDGHSGIILVGSPFNSSDPEEEKSEIQLRVELELRRMLDAAVARDYPLFGACYGVGTLGLHQGAEVDRTYGEVAGPVRIEVTPEGREDPVLAGVAASFYGYVGHKEAVRTLPPHAQLLATGQDCPVQMFRIGQNMYATQFHPELTARSLLYRLSVYDRHGYFDPEDFDSVLRRVEEHPVTEPPKMLVNFKNRYAR